MKFAIKVSDILSLGSFIMVIHLEEFQFRDKMCKKNLFIVNKFIIE